MKKLILSLSVIAIAAAAIAQQPTADAIPITSNIYINGSLTENCWLDATPIPINQNYIGETPTVTAEFKIIWSTQGLFIGVEGFDDVWAPYWITGEPDSLSDRVELYFDFSSPQKDGLGAKDSYGNYKIMANFQETTQGCTMYSASNSDINDTITCYLSSSFDAKGNFSMEFFIIDWDLKVGDGTLIELIEGSIIGFDVTIVDNDNNGGGRNRKVWANTGSNDDSWDNMDDVGLVRLLGEAKETNTEFDFCDWGDAKHMKNENRAKISFYPNPCNEHLIISSKEEFSQVQIINIVGKTILLETTSAKETELDISALPAGTYIVHITMDDEVVNKSIIVK